MLPMISRLQQFSTPKLQNPRKYSTSALKPNESAEIVIIGGGCVGCGIAHRLAEEGKTDVILIEKENSVSTITSAQAAGLVGQVRTDFDRVKLAMWSVETFSKFQEEDAVNPNWRQVGSLRIAETDERVEEFKRMDKVCKQAGLKMEFISPSEAKKMWPGMLFDKAKSIIWCPSDGYLQPYDLAMTYRWHARKAGVRFYENTPALGIEMETDSKGKPRVKSVKTPNGEIKCKTVINAAGAHGYTIAKMAGLELPIIPVRHHYIITEPIGKNKEIHPELPVLRLPDRTLYARPDVNSILVGGWEPEALSYDPRQQSSVAKSPLIEDDWPVLSNFAELFSEFYPKISDAGIRQTFNGWPTFTPDGKFIVGPSARVDGFVMAGGCNAHGVSGSAGLAHHVVESMGLMRSSSKVSDYVKSLSPDRFTERSWNWEEATKAAKKVYETYYFVK
eukprot:TRINITY_DN4529_c0_g1_i1.p1 TRINITY_DN4529_c0_g1~~TRINITY_DN4529_c0_g1_i1.p1  ORF type:complete len:447 (-),score=137.15 TRINITY_DN4529_c0_g1_i1:213-1553(-)